MRATSIFVVLAGAVCALAAVTPSRSNFAIARQVDDHGSDILSSTTTSTGKRLLLLSRLPHSILTFPLYSISTSTSTEDRSRSSDDNLSSGG